MKNGWAGAAVRLAHSAKVAATSGVKSMVEARCDHAHDSPTGRISAPTTAASSAWSPK